MTRTERPVALVRVSIDVTDQTFETDVLLRSKTTPVVIDLWAPWCGPCRQLGPIIEEAVAATGGQVELAKVNVDENPAVSQAFQVQSIPAVYAMKDGKVVDGFVGAQGQQAVVDFVQRLIPSAAEQELAALLEAGDETSLRKVLEVVPDHAEAITTLADLMVHDGRGGEALALLARVPESAETRRIAAAARVGDADGAVAGADDMAEKFAGLLDRVKDDDLARQEYLDLLELLGPDDPRTAGYRKALSARLF